MCKKYDVFVDWITIKQTHLDKQGQLPKVDAGFVLSVGEFDDVQDQENQHSFDIENEDFALELKKEGLKSEWLTRKRVQHRGSFETSILIYCDGTTVFLSGNVGRFNRPDNLYNLDFHQTIKKANWILSNKYGLPPFTFGRTSTAYYQSKNGDSKPERFREYGAEISRLDLTCNFFTGSPQKAWHVIDVLKSKSMSHVKSSGTAHDTTVAWGRKGGRLYTKAYIKSIEMLRHARSKIQRENIASSDSYKFAHDNGLVRIEVELDRRTLLDTGLRDIENVNMAKLIELYADKVDQLVDPPKFEIERVEVELFPKKLRKTVAMWLSGLNVRELMSQATFYRHRREILDYGVDISIRYCAEDKTKKAPIVSIVQLTSAPRPDWYSLKDQRERPVLRVVNG